MSAWSPCVPGSATSSTCDVQLVSSTHPEGDGSTPVPLMISGLMDSVVELAADEPSEHATRTPGDASGSGDMVDTRVTARVVRPARAWRSSGTRTGRARRGRRG